MNSNAKKNIAGFTLIEVLIVVAIIGIISLTAFFSYSSTVSRKKLDQTSKAVASFIEESRMQSVSGKNGKSYGVHFEATKVVRFAGSSYSSTEQSNETFSLSSELTINNISLSNAGSDILFSKITGAASANGTVDISLASDPVQKKVLRVEPPGLVYLE